MEEEEEVGVLRLVMDLRLILVQRRRLYNRNSASVIKFVHTRAGDFQDMFSLSRT